MTKQESMTLLLYTGDSHDEAGQKSVLTATAAKIVICSQYADLRDAQDKLIATVTWTTPIKAMRV